MMGPSTLRFVAYALFVQLINSFIIGRTFFRQNFLSKLPQPQSNHFTTSSVSSKRYLSEQFIVILGDDDDDDGEPSEEEEEEIDDEGNATDPYLSNASSEFVDERSQNTPSTALDWGGALSRLRERVEDVESGKSQDPSHTLFRLMSSQSPNQAIGSFISQANPQVVQAMSGAVSSLLGGLSSPQMGIETVVKTSGDKIGSLCFQLQITGYLIRNCEYVIALRDLMDLRGSATIQDYRDAFDKLDRDKSGYIEADEIEKLLDDVYNGKTPAFEISAFMKFFDSNKDGKISWEEFERGLGAAMTQKNQVKSTLNLLPGSVSNDDDEDDDDHPDIDPEVTGEIEIEQEDGSILKMDAKEYIKSLKEEAQALKDALRREKFGTSSNGRAGLLAKTAFGSDEFGSIAQYMANRQGDLKSMTEKISPDIVETMKKLVDYVLEGGQSGKGKGMRREEMEMEIPGSALQQLALWQLILGYQLREAEAKGDYLKLLD